MKLDKVQVDRRVVTVAGATVVWSVVALFALGIMLGFVVGRL